jgi:5-methylcytosine-specific restriction endonuclease McrA
MDRATQRLVRQRAGDECEYCGLGQVDVPLYVFQFDHVIPRQHVGTDDVSNLALACPHCNSHKGTNLAAIDPDSGRVVALFNPREDRWYDHFAREGPRIIGLTAQGRATARLLAMNTDRRIDLREGMD